jgi:hypothetical protein
MDAKITLSFDQDVISNAKKFADDNNISLSRLTEFVYLNMTTKNYKTIEDLHIADWVNMVAEGPVKYETKARSNKDLKARYYKSKK